MSIEHTSIQGTGTITIDGRPRRVAMRTLVHGCYAISSDVPIGQQRILERGHVLRSSEVKGFAKAEKP